MNKSDLTSDYSQVEATRILISELLAVGIQSQSLLAPIHMRQRLCYLADQLEPLLITTNGDNTDGFDAEREAIRSEMAAIFSEIKNRQQNSTTHVKHNHSQIALQIISKGPILSELMTERNSIQHQTDLVREQLSAIRKDSNSDKEKLGTFDPVKEAVSAEFFSLRRKIQLVDRKIRVITFFGLDVWETLEGPSQRTDTDGNL